MKTCASCHREIDPAAGFCPYCGTPQSKEAAAPAHIAEKNLDHLEGTVLDNRYRVIRKVGEGAMGVVYEAEHVAIEKRVAIKVLKLVDSGGQMVKRFLREAKAASLIDHPAIVTVTDFGQLPDGLAYSVMEFVDGKTLGEELNRAGTFPVKRAIRIAAQIAHGVVAAHAKGVVHRDLKPDNIFLCARGGETDIVKIVDFGIAKIAGRDKTGTTSIRLTSAGMIFGTPEYMSPEQARGLPDIDARADIYALGTILYEMLTGNVPHHGETPMAVLAMQVTDPVPPLRTKVDPDTIPPALEQAVMHALAKRREDRTATMQSLFDDLFSIQPEEVWAIDPSAHSGRIPATLAGVNPVDGEVSGRVRLATRDDGSVGYVAEQPPRSKTMLLALVAILPIIVFVVFAALSDDGEKPTPASTSNANTLVAAFDAAPQVDDAIPEQTSLPDATPAQIPTRIQMKKVVIQTQPPGADLFWQGKRIGKGGSSVRLPKGKRVRVMCRVRGTGRRAFVVFKVGQRPPRCVAELKEFPKR